MGKIHITSYPSSASIRADAVIFRPELELFHKKDVIVSYLIDFLQ